MAFKTTAEIPVPKRLVDQIIGQDKGVEIIKKAAKQKRNVLLIGEPGTGKSMLAQAMAELLPVEKLQDILILPNLADKNNPKVLIVPAGNGKKVLEADKQKSLELAAMGELKPSTGMLLFISLLFTLSIASAIYLKLFSDIILAAFIIIGGIFLAILIFASAFTSGLKNMRMGGREEETVPKLLVDNSGRQTAPFVDATGAHSGALLGDVRHDPFQCIPAGEKVLIDSGKPINIEKLVDPFIQDEIEREISDSFHILGGSDEHFLLLPSKRVRVYKRKYKGEVIEVKTQTGLSLRTTPNHPFAFLTNDLSVDYKRADGLNRNDFVIVANSLPAQSGKADVPYELLGCILADAYVGERRVEFKFAREFKIKRVCEDIKKAGLKFTLSKRKYTVIAINSADFVKGLKKMGLIEGKAKRIPEIIFKSDVESISLFLSRLISMDGYVGKQGQFEIVSSQKDLIFDIRALLLKFGVKASYRPRIDHGFAKGRLQHRLIWGNYDWAKMYYQCNVNPVHKKNLEEYFKSVSFKHVAFHDEMPVNFDYLEKIRNQIEISKEKVHPEYYSLNQNVNSSKNLTRNMLSKVCTSFAAQYSNNQTLKLERLVNGHYSFDKIVSIKKMPYDGYVYNLTTETGNYLVNGVLTHNSGGLGTPAHLRVEPGMIHKANKGVLFIDEVSTLSQKSQQELLSAMQDKRYSITGQSEMSSGAMVRTDPVPCDFLLIASGNLFDLEKMHPALRSRIRGYGYEIYLNEHIEDNALDRKKLERFVAQEVVKDGKIPHFTKDAVDEVIFEAKRRAGTKGKFTLKLRDLGGLVRAAGDIAVTQNAKIVSREHVMEAKKLARTLEQQLADRQILQKKEYEVFITKGSKIGRVNGLAVMGADRGNFGGILLPIEAQVATALSLREGKIIATGKLGEIAKEAVQNVSAIIKKYKGTDVSNYDMHIQFLQTYEGVEGDSASVSVATAVISALENIPVDLSVAMTGSLSVKGEVLPVGGVSAKIEAAIEAGAKRVIIPTANKDDVVLEKEKLKKVKIVTADNLCDVLSAALKPGKEKDRLLKNISKIVMC
jgi:lon-related putative ATP-dependent protease